MITRLPNASEAITIPIFHLPGREAVMATRLHRCSYARDCNHNASTPCEVVQVVGVGRYDLIARGSDQDERRVDHVGGGGGPEEFTDLLGIVEQEWSNLDRRQRACQECLSSATTPHLRDHSRCAHHVPAGVRSRRMASGDFRSPAARLGAPSEVSNDLSGTCPDWTVQTPGAAR